MASKPHLVLSWGGVTENNEKNSDKNENKAIFSEFGYDGNHPNWIPGITMFKYVYIHTYMQVCLYLFLCIFVLLCIYVSMYIKISLYADTYTYEYTGTHQISMNLRILKSKPQSTHKSGRATKDNKYKDKNFKWELFVFDVDALMTNTSDSNQIKVKHDIKNMMNDDFTNNVSSRYNSNVRINLNHRNATDGSQDGRRNTNMVSVHHHGTGHPNFR